MQQKKRRRKSRKKKVIGVILSLLVIVVMGGMAVSSILSFRNAETGDKLDYKAAYGLADNEYTVTLNNEITSYHAMDYEGHAYFHLKDVLENINSRFYWDYNENLLIYTKPDGDVKTYPEQTSYTDASGQTDLDYVPVKLADDQVYVAAEYVKLFTKCSLDIYQNPNRIVVRTDFSEKTMVDLTKETYIRYRGGVKAEVFRKGQAGEALYVLDDTYDGWTYVVTSDGYTGWVANKYIGDAYTQTPAEPEFTGFDYQTVQRDYKVKMVWHQVMSAQAAELNISSLDSCTGMNVVSPTFFAFNDTDGNIRSIVSQSYVDAAHSRGMEVWALFSNQFPTETGDLGEFDGNATNEVLGYTSKRENAVAQIIQMCKEAGIDGINLDFERIVAPSESETASANYLQFVRELSVACHQNNIIFSIDNYVPLYTAHYDRVEQNVFADYLVIMGYDEHYAGGGEAGSVASLSFVEQGIEDTLNAGVPASKVINGIPFYARIWYTDSTGQLFYYGDVTMTEAATYAANHGVEVQWREETGDSYITYTGDDGNEYQIYTESVDSVDRKMQLITKYDLAGVSCWKLGQENSGVWSVINQYLP